MERLFGRWVRYFLPPVRFRLGEDELDLREEPHLEPCRYAAVPPEGGGAAARTTPPSGATSQP